MAPRMARSRKRVEPYRLICADPPWQFGDRLPGKKRGAAKHYDVLELSEIMGYSLPPIADDAVLLLWRVAAMPGEALDVVTAWGFTPKSEIVWVKTDAEGYLAFGMGRYVRNCHEACIVATRGHGPSCVQWRSGRSVIFAPRQEHSTKPPEFFELVENVFKGPRVELFARVPTRPGWDVYGRESAGNPEGPAATSGA